LSRLWQVGQEEQEWMLQADDPYQRFVFSDIPPSNNEFAPSNPPTFSARKSTFHRRHRFLNRQTSQTRKGFLSSTNQIRFRQQERMVEMTEQECQLIIRLAWEDRSTFEDIKEKTGFSEAAVIKLMRGEMKPSSFRMWRKRVSGRMTKHRKRFREAMALTKLGRCRWFTEDERSSGSPR
jgi:uncharacterized protein (TIGR03643 family)